MTIMFYFLERIHFVTKQDAFYFFIKSTLANFQFSWELSKSTWNFLLFTLLLVALSCFQFCTGISQHYNELLKIRETKLRKQKEEFNMKNCGN